MNKPEPVVYDVKVTGADEMYVVACLQLGDAPEERLLAVGPDRAIGEMVRRLRDHAGGRPIVTRWLFEGGVPSLADERAEEAKAAERLKALAEDSFAAECPVCGRPEKGCLMDVCRECNEPIRDCEEITVSGHTHVLEYSGARREARVARDGYVLDRRPYGDRYKSKSEARSLAKVAVKSSASVKINRNGDVLVDNETVNIARDYLTPVRHLDKALVGVEMPHPRAKMVVIDADYAAGSVNFEVATDSLAVLVEADRKLLEGREVPPLNVDFDAPDAPFKSNKILELLKDGTLMAAVRALPLVTPLGVRGVLKGLVDPTIGTTDEHPAYNAVAIKIAAIHNASTQSVTDSLRKSPADETFLQVWNTLLGRLSELMVETFAAPDAPVGLISQRSIVGWFVGLPVVQESLRLTRLSSTEFEATLYLICGRQPWSLREFLAEVRYALKLNNLLIDAIVQKEQATLSPAEFVDSLFNRRWAQLMLNIRELSAVTFVDLDFPLGEPMQARIIAWLMERTTVRVSLQATRTPSYEFQVELQLLVNARPWTPRTFLDALRMKFREAGLLVH